MGIWQWVVIVNWIIHIVVRAYMDKRKVVLKFETAIIRVLLGFIVLYFGGFFS